MKIYYHNRTQLSPSKEGNATYVSFDELLAKSDVLSLNLALNASTRHIIGPAEFQKMKDGVVIVNTARGALIDEKALVSALDSGKVGFRLERGRFNIDKNRLTVTRRFCLLGSTSTNGSRKLRRVSSTTPRLCYSHISELRRTKRRKRWRYWSWITCARRWRRAR